MPLMVVPAFGLRGRPTSIACIVPVFNPPSLRA
jgi:hypothetical protein